MFGHHKDALSNTSLKARNLGIKNAIKKAPKVLMACPTFGLEPNPNYFFNTFMNAMNEFILRGWQVSTFLPYRRPIVIAENEIINLAITNGFDWIFRLDDDIHGFQPNFVNKLIDADKEIISGVMYIAGFPYSLCAFNRKDKSKSLIDIYENRDLELDEVDGVGVQPCDMTATPFTLIKTTIYEKILTPYFETKGDVPPDSVFFQKLLDAGVQPYVHMDVQLNHRWVTPWNRHYLYNAEARTMMANHRIDKESTLYKALVEEFGEDGRKDFYMLKGCHLVGEKKEKKNG